MTTEVRRIVEESRLAFQRGRQRAVMFNRQRRNRGPVKLPVKGRSIRGGAGWSVPAVGALYRVLIVVG